MRGDVPMLNKLLNDICFIYDESNQYLATMCEERLLDLVRNQRTMRCDKVRLSRENIDNAYKDGKYYLARLEQPEELRMKTFYCNVVLPKRLPTLKGKSIKTLTEMKSIFDTVVGILRDSAVSIDGNVYYSFVGGIPTSGSILLTNSDGEPVEVDILRCQKIEKYITSQNMRKLLSGVYRYKNELVTMNRGILDEYYGSDLLSKLESKGVRYRFCYFHIMLNGDYKSDFYYKSTFGIEEPFKGTYELLKLVKKHMSKGFRKSGYTARRLVSKNQLFTGKKSLYITIPDDAVLEQVSDGLRVKTAYGVNANFGYVHCNAKGVDKNSVRSNALSKFSQDYGGDTVIMSIVDSEKLEDGYNILKSLTYEIQCSLWEAVRCGYRENLDSYSSKIMFIASENGIEGVTELHIKFLFANVLAKKERLAQNVSFADCIKCLVVFLDYFIRGDADEKLRVVLRKMCEASLRSKYNENGKAGVEYRCEYGIVYTDGLADLYYENFFVGKTAFKVVK